MLKTDGNPGLVILGADDAPLANAWSDDRPNCEANAALIVEAVNNHDALKSTNERLVKENENLKDAVAAAHEGDLEGREAADILEKRVKELEAALKMAHDVLGRLCPMTEDGDGLKVNTENAFVAVDRALTSTTVKESA